MPVASKNKLSPFAKSSIVNIFVFYYKLNIFFYIQKDYIHMNIILILYNIEAITLNKAVILETTKVITINNAIILFLFFCFCILLLILSLRYYSISVILSSNLTHTSFKYFIKSFFKSDLFN